MSRTNLETSPDPSESSERSERSEHSEIPASLQNSEDHPPQNSAVDCPSSSSSSVALTTAVPDPKRNRFAGLGAAGGALPCFNLNTVFSFMPKTQLKSVVSKIGKMQSKQQKQEQFKRKQQQESEAQIQALQLPKTGYNQFFASLQ